MCQNASMNEQIAQALIASEMRRLETLSYAHLVSMIGKVETKKVVGEDVRLIVAADDGGWRAYKPLTDGFIMRPDGSVV